MSATQNALLCRQMIVADDAISGGMATARQIALMAYVGDYPDCSVGPVAEALGMQKPVVTRAVDVLEKSGFILNMLDEADQRRRKLRLTTAGQNVLKRIREGQV